MVDVYSNPVSSTNPLGTIPPVSPTTPTTGVESPENPTGGLVETPAQAAVQPGQYPNPIQTPEVAPITQTDSSQQYYQSINGGQSQQQIDNLALMNKYTKENGGYVINPDGTISPKTTPATTPVTTPTTSEVPTVTPPIPTPLQGIDTTTTDGLADWYNKDQAGFKSWAKASGKTDADIYQISKAASVKITQAETNKVTSDLDSIQNGTYPLTDSQKAQLEAVKKLWESTIKLQTGANETYTNQANTLASLSGREKYNAQNVIGQVQQAVQTGIDRINNFQAQEQKALADMQQSFMDQDYKMVMAKHQVVVDSEKSISDELDKIYTANIAAKKVIQDAQDKIAQDTYDRVTKPIQETLSTITSNNAPKSIIDAVKGATTVEDAISAAGDYLQIATGELGDYLFYKRDKVSNGLTPLGYTEWKDLQDKKQIQLESSKSYASAYASAMGKAAADKVNGVDQSTMTDANPDASEILGQTGLDKLTFDYLTMGTKALTRLTAAERIKVISDAGEWLKSHGVDSSTFISQYDAYNKTLENNIKRVNQVKVAEGEIKGTLDNLAVAADDSSFGSLRWGNVASLFAGKEVNDPNVAKYSFHLTQIRQELAMYNAAAAGKINNDGSVRTDDGDLKEADRIIKDGFAAGSIEGFNNALDNSVKKMDTVLNNSLNTSRQNVWGLFGVGQNYKPSYDNPEQYLNTSPNNVYEWQDATKYLKSQGYPNPSAEEVFQYIMSK